jgi:branched-chain amino acid transport system permease protein
VDQFLQQLVNGITLGATYALIALGYTMVYGIIQLINFAHGEIFMVGAFGSLAMLSALPDSMPAALQIVLILIAAMATSVIVALLVERLAYRPLRHAPRLAPLITAIGVSIFLQEAVRLFYPDAKSPRSYPSLIGGPNVTFGNIDIQRVSFFVVGLAILLMLGLQAFVKTSKTGKAMRATAQDPDTARLMGINTDRIIVITFAIGAALAGVAGVFQGLRFNQISFNIGFIGGLKAFTAAVLGGIGNIAGAVYGGFILGLVEVMATQYVGDIPGLQSFGGGAWKDVWAFVVLIVLLVFRPSGLLGERIGTRS